MPATTAEKVIAVVGIDIGKNSFHIVAVDDRGAIVLRQKWSRSQMEARFANMPPCLMGMEACVGAHHLSRKLKALGHDARLMPAKYVRPYSKGQKNDFRDAEAIAEAVQRPTMKFVTTKTADQLDLQALHRVRERLVSQRTGIINQIRAASRHRSPAGATLLANRTATHSRHATRRSLTPHGARHRGSDRGLATARSAHRRAIERDRGACQAGSRVRSADERPWHRADHLQRHGRRDRQRRWVFQGARLRRLARPRA